MADSSTLRVALLGFGTVGEGTYRMLVENEDEVSRKMGFGVEVVGIGVKSPDKPRSLPRDRFTGDLTSLCTRDDVDAVIELIGGETDAYALVRRAVESGKHVVTANKELVAKHGAELLVLAHSRGVDLHFEAAVGGGIPVVQPLKHQLAGNDVIKMMGILNGTTNLILTRMAQEGAEFADALAEAQAQGYAEADPSSDVDGYDTQYKIAILTSISFGGQVPLDGVYREGIRGIGAKDMHYADVLGYRIKLLGIVEEVAPSRVMVRVHPTLVPKTHPLSHVDDVYNALWLHGDFVGDLMFSGRGAGAHPTASAVVGDLIDVGRSMRSGSPSSVIPYTDRVEAVGIDDLETRYYIRLEVVDKPNVLGKVSTIFGEHEVGLAAMEMRTLDEGLGEIVFMTHVCRERDLDRALAEVRESPVVTKVESRIRVEA